MPPNRFESEVESFLEGSHGDRTHIKRADHPRLHHYAGRYSITCMNTALCARVWVETFRDREQQPMTLPPFANTIAGQLLR